MSKTKLVLQDSFSIAEKLDFICENIKIVSQSRDELLIIEVIEWHGAWRGNESVAAVREDGG
jgi:hypothetical protein